MVFVCKELWVKVPVGFFFWYRRQLSFAFHPQAIDWLTANVQRVLERVDAKDPFVDEASKK